MDAQRAGPLLREHPVQYEGVSVHIHIEGRPEPLGRLRRPRTTGNTWPTGARLLSEAAARAALYNAGGMQGGEFDEVAFFRAIHESGARALLIGRRALVLLGLPVLTADYDFWIGIDDIAVFNNAVAPCGLLPTHASDSARRRGRYAVENDEHVDVLVARSITTVDGIDVAFEAVWSRRQTVALGAGVDVQIPAREDLILTKRFADRPKDLEDIRLLRALDPEGRS